MAPRPEGPGGGQGGRSREHQAWRGAGPEGQEEAERAWTGGCS